MCMLVLYLPHKSSDHVSIEQNIRIHLHKLLLLMRMLMCESTNEWVSGCKRMRMDMCVISAISKISELMWRIFNIEQKPACHHPSHPNYRIYFYCIFDIDIQAFSLSSSSRTFINSLSGSNINLYKYVSNCGVYGYGYACECSTVGFDLFGKVFFHWNIYNNNSVINFNWIHTHAHTHTHIWWSNGKFKAPISHKRYKT